MKKKFKWLSWGREPWQRDQRVQGPKTQKEVPVDAGDGARGTGLEVRGGKLDRVGSGRPLGGLGLLQIVICAASGWALGTSGWALRQGTII